MLQGPRRSAESPHPTSLRETTCFRKREKGARGILAGLLVMPIALAVCAAAHADPLPTIVTYELSKSRHDERALARDPKSFWVGAIVARIEARKSTSSMHLKAPATVEVGFIIGRDGKLVSSTIEKSSGNPALDRQAIAMLDRAAPFPPMPAALSDDHLAFTVPLRFK